MANKKILEVVQQGPAELAKFRKANPEVLIDLVDADLKKANLRGGQLRRANLVGAKLQQARLMKAELDAADLTRADLTRASLKQASLVKADLSNSALKQVNFAGADLSGADLSGCDLTEANLRKADLRRANLQKADLTGANLTGAKLRQADLSSANLIETTLDEADFNEANLSETHLDRSSLIGTNLNRTIMAYTRLTDCTLGWGSLGGVDLTSVQGLETVTHIAPSNLGADTLDCAGKNLPLNFLQGCGVPESTIKHIIDQEPNPAACTICFLSYSERDQEFAQVLHGFLQNKGIRCWLSEKPVEEEAAKPSQIGRADHLWHRILLCTSSHSLSSWWVDREVDAAFEKEKQLKKETGKDVQVLIPVNLDGYMTGGNWKHEHLKKISARTIADFSSWRRSKEKFVEDIDKVIEALGVVQEKPKETSKDSKKKKK